MTPGAHSKRFVGFCIGFAGVLVAAVLRHWLTGIDPSLVITAAGLVTAYLAAETARASKGGNGGQQP